MKKLTPALLLIILFLASCQPPPPTPYPSPQPTQEPTAVPRPLSNTDTLFPILHTAEPTHPKAGIALAYWQRGIPHGLLNLPGDVYYHNWGISGGIDETGRKVSMVWCSRDDYITWFRDYVLDHERASGQALADFVLWSNEPDRDDQCDNTINETAALYLELVAICPKCKFIGPMYSTADDGRKVADVWERVRELCGLPCPALDSWYGDSLHIYPRNLANHGPSRRVTDFCLLVYGGECQRPIWVTEVGWTACGGEARDGFARWVAEMDADERIERYFVYSIYLQDEGDCRFLPLVEWEGGGLTAVGRGFVEGLEVAYP